MRSPLELPFAATPYGLSGLVLGRLLNHAAALAGLDDAVHAAPHKAGPCGTSRLIADISDFMTLRPGDVILTGTSDGVVNVEARPALAFRRHQGQRHRPQGRHMELQGIPRTEERRGLAGRAPHALLGRVGAMQRKHTMSLYGMQKFLYQLNRDPRVQASYREDRPGLLDDYLFAYLNLRIARGRSADVQRRAGEALSATARRHFEPLFASRYIGLTLQIDEGAEVFNVKHSTIRPLFTKS